MGNVYDSIITGLEEAIDDAKGEGKKLKKRVVPIEPVKTYSAREIKYIRKVSRLSQNYLQATWMFLQRRWKLGNLG